MQVDSILNALQVGEDKDWEFKSAKGGLPGSMWETYSAMANTDGGCIVLGVKETDEGEFEVQGLDDLLTIKKNFWSLANNRGKVSCNLLTNDDVQVVEIATHQVLVIQVRRATRTERPVYVGQNPLIGTYRRYYEGDYQCSQDEVKSMLSDQSDQPADSLILKNFGMDDLDKKSLEQYRNRFASRSPTHAWLKENDQTLLEKLGGWRTDRQTGESGLTVAGLLMFGKDEAIRDPHAIPQYNIDFREILSDDPNTRWTDRVWIDGTWIANLFQFFERVYPRLVSDLKIPFQFALQPDGTTTATPNPSAIQRHDDTIVHEAIREAFVNSIIHANFRGQGGIVIKRYRIGLIFSNPGTLLLGIKQTLQGGVSECRNKSLQGMFALLGYGEKAGSGIDKIAQGWASQKWRAPNIQEVVKPDRILCSLPMISLLPEESLARLQATMADDFSRLNGEEVQALVTADVEQSVTNLRLQQFSHQHPADISKMLQTLVSKNILVKDGYGRWMSYRLSPTIFPSKKENSIPHNDDCIPHNDGNIPHNDDRLPYNEICTDDPKLVEIAFPARKKSRLPPEEMKEIILTLCAENFLTVEQISLLIDRTQKGIQNRFLGPMVKEGKLKVRYPNEPTHPDQAYTTNIQQVDNSSK